MELSAPMPATAKAVRVLVPCSPGGSVTAALGTLERVWGALGASALRDSGCIGFAGLWVHRLWGTLGASALGGSGCIAVWAGPARP